MTERIRFPKRATDAQGPSESDLIIELFSGGTIHDGGEPAYVDVSAWRNTDNDTASPFVGIVIECSADGALIAGDGVDPIGLFGEITGVGKFLLGFLGINSGTAVPQIPIVSATVGFAQIVADVALYDKLSVGAISGDIELGGVLTVRARPIRDRYYQG